MANNPFISPYSRGQPLRRAQQFTHLMGPATAAPAACPTGMKEVQPADLLSYVSDKSGDIFKGVIFIEANATIPGLVIGAVHGYRRNKGDILLTLGWGLLGAIFPFMTTGLAIAQGLIPGGKKD